MKGFFALVLEALRDIDLRRLKNPLVLLATANEESDMCGARALLETHEQLGRHAVIGEPTGLRPVRLHKGIAMEAIRLRGRSGHSSDPALGINALDGMHLALDVLPKKLQGKSARVLKLFTIFMVVLFSATDTSSEMKNIISKIELNLP